MKTDTFQNFSVNNLQTMRYGLSLEIKNCNNRSAFVANT